MDDPDDYPWSRFALRKGLEKPFRLSGAPVILPANWPKLVSRNIVRKDHDRICNSINRGAPLGQPDWIKRTAAKLNLESTLRLKGRPKNVPDIFNSLPIITPKRSKWSDIRLLFCLNNDSCAHNCFLVNGLHLFFSILHYF